MNLNFDIITPERYDEINRQMSTDVFLFIMTNIKKGISLQELFTEVGKYVETPEELAYATYTVTGAAIQTGLFV